MQRVKKKEIKRILRFFARTTGWMIAPLNEIAKTDIQYLLDIPRVQIGNLKFGGKITG